MFKTREVDHVTPQIKTLNIFNSIEREVFL